MNHSYKPLLLKIIFSLFVSFFIFYLSKSYSNWINFWGFFNIPASEPFSDFKALNIFLEYKESGFNPYYKNPNSDPVHSVLIYPSIWLYIFDFFNFKNALNFDLGTFIILFAYFFVLIDFFLKINNKYFKYLFLIFFFSTSNFLLIERLNIEIILFCLVYFALISKSFFYQSIFYLLGLILKIFPIFSIFMFIHKKKNFFLIFLISITYIFLMRNEIVLIKNNVIEYALIFAYGALSISKGIYFYSTKFNLFVNNENYFFFKNFIIFGFSIIVILIILINFKFNIKKEKYQISNEEKMFLAGSGIFIGTFVSSANIDYRLIFLLLTLPYILSSEKVILKNLYVISLIICFNSLIFEGGDTYTFLYFLKVFIIYSFKLCILFINCIFFGIICNKFININFDKNFLKFN